MSTLAVVAPSKPQETERPLIQEITLSSIKPSKANPRRHMDETALAELAANIKTHGVLQPILIRPVAAGAYEIVCGERRWRASKTAGKNAIPARIVELNSTPHYARNAEQAAPSTTGLRCLLQATCPSRPVLPLG